MTTPDLDNAQTSKQMKSTNLHQKERFIQIKEGDGRSSELVWLNLSLTIVALHSPIKFHNEGDA
ncbi:hypothetical protein ACSBR2_013879 [Camellia fascicularis]